jgi:hypothetical protein
MQQILSQRMTLPEAIEAATRIIGSYPYSANVPDSYLGALAANLACLPRQVALKCADPRKGIARSSKFMPSIADLVAWGERECEPLYRAAQSELRTSGQLRGRAAYATEQGADRLGRLDIAGLMAKFGDWHDGWREPGTRAREERERAEAMLVGSIGRAAFDALPDR